MPRVKNKHNVAQHLPQFPPSLASAHPLGGWCEVFSPHKTLPGMKTQRGNLRGKDAQIPPLPGAQQPGREGSR